MDPQLFDFFQSRIATAYKEQLWAVALIGAMIAFLARNIHLVNHAMVRLGLLAGITIGAGAAGFFVWSRHAIFVHYDGCLKSALEKPINAIGFTFHIEPSMLVTVAAYSGVVLYSAVIVGMYVFGVWLICTSGNDPIIRKKNKGVGGVGRFRK